jgi:hypothetical protein
MDVFNLISKDAIILIMKYLSIGDIGRLTRCCKRFHTVSESEILWKFLLMRDLNVTKNYPFDAESKAKKNYQEEKEFESLITWDRFGDYGWLLSQACSKGDLASVKCCIRKGIDINQFYWLFWTPLMTATRAGQVDIVKILLNEEVDINKTNEEGCTAFMFACINSRVLCAELLIKRGADINKADNIGRTALMRVVQLQNIQIIFFLLKRGAKVNIVDKRGFKALYLTTNKSIRNILLNFSPK